LTERLLTAAELADTLGLAAATVLDWFEAERLPGFKVGRAVRFRESEVLDWLERDCRRGPLPALAGLRAEARLAREEHANPTMADRGSSCKQPDRVA
jgi:excisionase family DNA binding protein